MRFGPLYLINKKISSQFYYYHYIIRLSHGFYVKVRSWEVQTSIIARVQSSPDLQNPPDSFISKAFHFILPFFSVFFFKQTISFPRGLTLQEQEVSKHSSVLVRNRPLQGCTKHGRPLLATEVLTGTPSLGNSRTWGRVTVLIRKSQNQPVTASQSASCSYNRSPARLYPVFRTGWKVLPSSALLFLFYCFFPPLHIILKSTCRKHGTLLELYLFNKPVTLHTLHWTPEIDTIKTLLKNKP